MTIEGTKMENDTISHKMDNNNANFTTMNSIYIGKLSEQANKEKSNNRVAGTARHIERVQLSGEGYLTQRLGTIRKGLAY